MRGELRDCKQVTGLYSRSSKTWPRPECANGIVNLTEAAISAPSKLIASSPASWFPCEGSNDVAGHPTTVEVAWLWEHPLAIQEARLLELGVKCQMIAN